MLAKIVAVSLCALGLAIGFAIGGVRAAPSGGIATAPIGALLVK